MLFSLTGSCPPGEHKTNDRSNCVPCLEGMFKEQIGPEDCTQCIQTAGDNPEGLTTRQTGATNMDECVGKTI